MDETTFEFYLWGERLPVEISRVVRAEWNGTANAYIVEDEDGKTYGFPVSSVRYYTREDHSYGSEESAGFPTTSTQEGLADVIELYPDQYDEDA